MKNKQIEIVVVNTEFKTRPIIKRVPQEWKAGWKKVSYCCQWYELQKEGKHREGQYYIDLNRPIS